MKLFIVSAVVTLLAAARASVAVPTQGYHGYTVGVPLPPKMPVQIFNATAGYNATHAHLASRSDLAARQAYSGQATWFYPGLGACGGTNTQYEHVVALDAPLWNNGANCWRGITIQAYGQQVDAAIVDLCPGCGYGDLDMAPALFEAFTGLDTGVFQMTWWYR
ncbi:hypothetical protein BDV93DRAFT_545520 [Ceratobasidium sp. AG-I]|nr:hypothetical protein BDV93DRAFT_545520 [Ceratobasidium sp. AG-I]